MQMQMRFDGTLGFAGGVLDEGETPEHCVTREFLEEMGSGEAGGFEVIITEQVCGRLLMVLLISIHVLFTFFLSLS